MRLPFQGRYERFRKLQREKMGEQPIVPICLVVVAILAAAGYFFIVR